MIRLLSYIVSFGGRPERGLLIQETRPDVLRRVDFTVLIFSMYSAAICFAGIPKFFPEHIRARLCGESSQLGARRAPGARAIWGLILGGDKN